MFNNPAVWLFAALAAPFAFLAVRYWQHALFGVFVLLVFEGALRKWAFPWAQAQIYLVKDVILLAVYLGFMLDSRRNLPAPKGVGFIKIVLVVGFVWGCLEVLNPNSPSILVGLMGLKSYFLYAPVAFILPYAIKSREHLFVLIRRYIIMAIPVAVLGFIQIMAGPASSLNVYVSHSEDTPAMLAYFGRKDFVRTSGTFSYISGYTAFLNFIALLAIGYNMAHGWRLKNNIIPLLALTLVVGAMFTTGSRGHHLYPACSESNYPLVGCNQPDPLSSDRHAPMHLGAGHCNFGVEHISSSRRSIHGARERQPIVWRDASAII